MARRQRLHTTRLRHFGPAALAAVLCLGAAGARAEPERGADTRRVVDCLGGNLPVHSLRRDFELERPGDAAPLQASSFWKRNAAGESMLRMSIWQPERSMQRSGLLMIWDRLRTDVFLYKSNTRRTRKIPVHEIGHSLFGNELRFGELALLHSLLENGLSERLPDTEIEGRESFVLESFPGPATGYTRVLAAVDKATCVPLDVRFHGLDTGQLLARVTAPAASLAEVDGIHYARELRLEDHRRDDTVRLVVHRVDVDAPVPSHLFDERTLSSLPALP